jgi:unsaturated rhamnogalacturonyl hydrolase
MIMKIPRHFFLVIIIVANSLMISCKTTGQKKENLKDSEKWSVKMANTVLAKSDSLVYYVDRNPKWAYDVAFLGMAVDRLGNVDAKYSKYMEDWVSFFVKPDGSVYNYKLTEYNLDGLFPGRNVITVYKRNHDQRYKVAIDNLIEQLKTHPKTNSGGYWHKNIYQWQMWLDGIYMASTFMAHMSITLMKNVLIMIPRALDLLLWLP